MKAAVSKDSVERTLKLLAEPDPDDEIQREFLEYHRLNPHVYKFLVRFAREAVEKLDALGKARCYGIAACVERARWHVNFEVKGYADFKINNDFRSRYARMIMRNEPGLLGVFTLRELQSTKLPAMSEIVRKANASLTEGSNNVAN